MGIFDRFRHKAHDDAEEARSSLGGGPEQDTTAMTDAAQRAALAHDEAADAFSVDTEKAREAAQAADLAEHAAEERAREEMTAEGDPWD
ncbi:hypothetical protein ACFVVX_17940 [Kitasatospora sp. NPDC058170]|uniref:hypothetical protein n=1 Tax=Kitasatospora sp. NPDC058170 TaxID=3346364 RepID=UPI0036DD9A1F